MPQSVALPDRANCVIRDLLHSRASGQPAQDFMLFESGERWTFADALVRVRRYAAGLAAAGVRTGDFVLSWQGNGPMAVTSFLAINYLGAVYVPINTSYRGRSLEHVVANSGARLMLGDGRLLDRLAGVDTASLERVIVIGDERPALPGIALDSAASLAAAGDSPPEADIAPWDTHMVIYRHDGRRACSPRTSTATQARRAFATSAPATVI